MARESVSPPPVGMRGIATAVLALVLALGSALMTPGAAHADVPAVSSVSWREAKPKIESYLGTPYVWGGKDDSGWDCSGFVGWVMVHVYGTGWPGGSPGYCGVDAIKSYVQDGWVFHGDSADDYNAAFDAGTVRPGDIIVFYNSSGSTVHSAIAGEDQTIYHAWSEYYGTCQKRFDFVWGINGGHGKVYGSFDVYRGLDDLGRIRLQKSSALPAATDGNPNYSLAGAEYAVYDEGGSQVATLVTDETGSAGPTGDLPAGTYTVREAKAPSGFSLDPKEYTFELGSGTWDASREVLVAPDPEVPVTVDIELSKHDAERQGGAAQGSATLAGARLLVEHYALDPSGVESPSDLDGADPDMSATVVTDEDGRASVGAMRTPDGTEVEGVPLGVVLVTELEAPEGYLVAGEPTMLKVAPGEGGTASVGGSPTIADEVARGGVTIAKNDLETGENAPQGGAAVDGARFQIVNASAAAVVVGGVEYGPGETVATIATESGRASTAPDALPYGTYEVSEVEAPEGYLGTDRVAEFSITEDGQMVEFVGEEAFANQVVRGGVRIAKNDAETGENAPQGGASVDGAVFEVVNANGSPVLVGGEEVAPGEVALTLETEGGTAESEPDALPYGDYAVRELEAPEGYLGTGAELAFSIDEDGQLVELAGEGAMSNQVKRGDLELVKVSDGDLSRMAGVPFEIASKTTGEAHIVVTDGNGYASTASPWNPHTSSTNANDGVSDGSWDASAGVWFGASAPDDSKGALPYDTYELTELPCAANEGKELLGPIEVRIYRDSATVDLGTLTNDDLPRTAISKKLVTGEDELPGATLRVYDGDGELVDEWVSGEEPHELTLSPGAYTLHEEAAPDGYLVASDIEFEVVEGEAVTKVEMVDDFTKVDAGKVDAETGEALAGATMQVVDAEGRVVEEWVSDGEPHRIEALPPGEYALRETEAPEGYALADDVSFTVEGTAEAQAVTMADEALPGATPGGLPQTGDRSWAVPAACAAGAAACIAGALAFGPRRDGKPKAKGGKRWKS